MLLYTDGLIERNPRISGDAGLRSLLADVPAGDVDALVAEIERRGLGCPPGPLPDDVAVLALQADAPAPDASDPGGAGARVLVRSLGE